MYHVYGISKTQNLGQNEGGGSEYFDGEDYTIITTSKLVYMILHICY